MKHNYSQIMRYDQGDKKNLLLDMLIRITIANYPI